MLLPSSVGARMRRSVTTLASNELLQQKLRDSISKPRLSFASDRVSSVLHVHLLIGKVELRARSLSAPCASNDTLAHDGSMNLASLSSGLSRASRPQEKWASAGLRSAKSLKQLRRSTHARYRRALQRLRYCHNLHQRSDHIDNRRDEPLAPKWHPLTKARHGGIARVHSSLSSFLSSESVHADTSSSSSLTAARLAIDTPSITATIYLGIANYDGGSTCQLLRQGHGERW